MVVRLSALQALIPMAAFLVVNMTVGLPWAMGAASSVSLALIVRRQRRADRVGLLLPLSLAYIVAKAVLGLVTGSAVYYFGVEVILDIGLAVIAIISVFFGRPLVGMLAPELLAFADGVQADPRYRTAMMHITLVWGVLRLFQLAWELWMLANISPNQFVLLKMMIAWPLNGLYWLGAFAYLRRRLAPIEPRFDRPFVDVVRLLLTPA